MPPLALRSAPGPARLTLALGLALLAAACAGDEGPPNVLLITIDTLRADHLSAYGSKSARTPHMDRLAEGGVLFEAAYTDVPWTLPAMTSTLTGTLALRHGVRSGNDPLAEGEPTVAEILRRRGYRTGAVVGSYALDARFGLARGFDVYDDELFVMRADDEVSDAALALLEELAASPPFFLWVHYFGPHSLLDRSLSWQENQRRHVENYPAKVSHADAAVGRLLDALDAAELAERTLVLLHADHGESLGEHRWVGHGRYVYEDNLRVPMILRWPGHLPADARNGALVGNIDLAATILDAAGAGKDAAPLDGRSLLSAVRSGQPVRAELYFETYLSAFANFADTVKDENGRGVRVGVRRTGVLHPPWKLIVSEPHSLAVPGESTAPEPPAALQRKVERTELYRLSDDPGEKHSLAKRYRVRSRMLSDSLGDYRARATPSGTGRAPELPPDHVERLRQLGYVE